MATKDTTLIFRNNREKCQFEGYLIPSLKPLLIVDTKSIQRWEIEKINREVHLLTRQTRKEFVTSLLVELCPKDSKCMPVTKDIDTEEVAYLFYRNPNGQEARNAIKKQVTQDLREGAIQVTKVNSVTIISREYVYGKSFIKGTLGTQERFEVWKFSDIELLFARDSLYLPEWEEMQMRVLEADVKTLHLSDICYLIQETFGCLSCSRFTYVTPYGLPAAIIFSKKIPEDAKGEQMLKAFEEEQENIFQYLGTRECLEGKNIPK